MLTEEDTESILSHLRELAEHEMFPQLAVSLVDRAGILDTVQLSEAAPWLDVSVPSAVPDLEAAVAFALDAATTRLVEFVRGSAAHTDLQWAIERGNILAERFGLLDAPFPLLYLTGWNDHRIIGAYRAWIAARHGDDIAEWRTRLDHYLQMLPYRNLGANIHGIDIVDDGATLRITGTARRGDTDSVEPPDHDVRLVLLDAAREPLLSVDTRPSQRMVGGRERWTGFSADVPIESLPLGRTTMDIQLSAPEGYEHTRVPVKTSVGMLVASRPVVTSGRRFQVFPVHGSDRAEIVTLRAGGSWHRLRWGMTVMRRDLGAIVHRRKFAWARVIRTLTRPFFLGRPIWLVGERPDTARDNGYHLFAHLARERPDIRAYYLMDESSAQFDQMSRLGPVVKHSSWRHRLLMYHSTALVNAYSIKHMVPRQWSSAVYARAFSWRVGAFRIYLKHGVHMNTKVIKRRVSGYDLFLTATTGETKGARETSGYGPQIAQTGLPRYDALIPTPPSRTVLFMPTWRIYFQPKLFSDETEAAVPFEGSTYQRFMQEFFASPRLHALLERHDYTLQFMPHYNMREHLTDLRTESERVTVLDGAAANIQDVMRGADLFLTDHSSVHFDIAYLGTPLIYSHFDNAEYRTMHALASWFDHECDGFGPVTYDLESTLDAVERYLAAGCVREELYDQRAATAFAYHDHHNSARAVAAAEQLLHTGWMS
jgi:CDP-glycerol glycerophosphotransferase (TagB/SpsB family)